MNKLKNNENGITLIAIGITVIVLLILAGITIATLTGDNGILKKAEEAKDTTKQKEELEKIDLALITLKRFYPGKIQENNLRKELNKNGFESVTADSTNIKEINGIYFFTSDTNHVYKILSSGDVSKIEGINNITNIKETNGRYYFTSDEEKIYKVLSNGDIEEIAGVDDVTNKGLNIFAEWINENTINFAVNGKVSEKTYIRIRKGDILIANSPGELYKKEYMENPLYKIGEKVFLKYEYISGNESKTDKTFTVKYREASTSNGQINTAELIANHSKQNFKMNSTFKNTGILDKNVSTLSLFMDIDCEFDNLNFRVTYGKE